MGIRITTWNVNGIRNPFGYQPWRDKRTFDAMFDILEADIVVFQETKIQRKDLRDDMVLVPGWDNYWSLPKHKKGYSGVVVYTRNSTCAPIRAEEGITGLLTPPNSTVSFRDGPENEQIGGYPSYDQLSQIEFDPATLDAEGRCVILEFPAFVLLGTYCPAERDETRTHFRTAFLNILDCRIRNLAAMGKRVVWTGDFNISREQIDSAAYEETIKKRDMDPIEWISTPARRMFNQLLVDGKVVGERDEGRERSVLWDICRSFHEGRKGMYTCWETKVNARPGNFGARIDYVVCSHEMKDWFSDSNIQEGLMGSDHCPVYAVTKDTVLLEDEEKHISDIVNPEGMFKAGVRLRPWSTKDLLPMSGKLLQEFDGRRSIRDMFSRKATPISVTGRPDPSPHENVAEFLTQVPTLNGFTKASPSPVKNPTPTKVGTQQSQSKSSKSDSLKRSASDILTATPPQPKRSKSNSQTSSSNAVGKGQKSLMGFFAPKTTSSATPSITTENNENDSQTATAPSFDTQYSQADTEHQSPPSPAWVDPTPEEEAANFETRKNWGKLFSRPVAPKCEHDEPCKTMLTKKPGINCGRSFWMCNRPLGPSGNKEKGTQWRCGTFIWCSDWGGSAREPS